MTRDELFTGIRFSFENNINVPELRKVLEYITANPDQHDQGRWLGSWVQGTHQTERVIHETGEVFEAVKEDQVWHCKTTGCAAGWAAVLNGWSPVMHKDGMVYRKGDGVRAVSEVAANVLGFNPQQAGEFFAGSNSLHYLWWLAEAWTEGEITIPEGMEDD